MTRYEQSSSADSRAVDKRAGQTHFCDEDQVVGHGLATIHITIFCQCGCAWRSTDASIALGMAEAHIRRNDPDVH